MALYEGLNRGPAQAGEPSDFRTLRARMAKEGPAAPMLDRIMGAGAGHTLARSVGTALGGAARQWRAAQSGAVRPGARREPPAKAWSKPRMQAVGSGESHLPSGRKGLGRVLIIAAGLAWAVAALRPWQRSGALRAEMSALLRLPEAGQSDGAVDGSRAAAQTAQTARDAAALDALPLQPATGKPMGLWQDGAGRWWKADASGALAPCPDPNSSEYLGLPEIRGVAARPEAYRGGRRLLLDLPSGRLGDLLPLDPSVSSEVRALVLDDPAQPVLVTLDGVRCLLGGGDWAERQKRLALVLADLAARRRRVAQVDLRYDGTAVVRPLGR